MITQELRTLRERIDKSIDEVVKDPAKLPQIRFDWVAFFTLERKYKAYERELMEYFDIIVNKRLGY